MREYAIGLQLAGRESIASRILIASPFEIFIPKIKPTITFEDKWAGFSANMAHSLLDRIRKVPAHHFDTELCGRERRFRQVGKWQVWP
jgi:hypothetical protein